MGSCFENRLNHDPIGVGIGVGIARGIVPCERCPQIGTAALLSMSDYDCDPHSDAADSR
jgi:hypothetical protein